MRKARTSKANPDANLKPEWLAIKEALSIPQNRWTQREMEAKTAFERIVRGMVRSQLTRFGLPTHAFRSDSVVRCFWSLVIADCLSSLNPKLGFRSFCRLNVIRAVNNTSDGYSGRGKRRICSISAAVNIPSKHPSPLQRLLQVQTEKETADAIDNLRETLRIPFKCRFYDGTKVIEIAKMLGVSQGAISKRLYDAKNELRLRLQHLRE
jgi:RNA polymerase sigma factor (sigma-70 family)